MSKLPQVKPTRLVAFFLKKGFVVIRQVGLHARLVHPDGKKITIAIHTKSIPLGTLQSILKQANMSREEFLEEFKK